MRKFIKFLFIFYLLAFLVVWIGRIALIYPFDSTEIAPRQAGEPRINASRINSFDDTSLVVWQAAAKPNKPTIVYFHGNAGNLAGRVERFRRLLDRGYGLIAMAYRGSSGSEGKPDQALITQDAQWLINAIPLQARKNVVFYGESLGTGVAVQLARTHPPSALILEAPYRSITELASSQMPFFPIKAILDQRWNTYEAIQTLDVPLLVLHGDLDQLIPVDHGKSVFSASPSNAKTLKTLPNAGHSNLWSIEGQKTIYTFLSKLPKY
jgi:pimeloyl-ACP methyl ester carboxylesterase